KRPPPTNDVTLIKVVDYMSDRVNDDSYNQTHAYATLSDELYTSRECEVDAYLIDSYPVFGDTPKDSSNESFRRKPHYIRFVTATDRHYVRCRCDRSSSSAF
ncbi:hypothetical protein, partial [Pantoea stewartii]|uniref:hypothetical protein n=1 Tax=Pantoea stewartii TaxID=66269 RepID=UPI0025A03D48